MLTDQLPSLVFFLMVLILTVFDTRRLHTIITPFTVAAWPFVIISLTTNFLLGYIGFPAMSMRAHVFLLINLIIIWIVGYIFSGIYQINKSPFHSSDVKVIFRPFVKFQYFLMILSIILSLVVLYRVYSLINQFGGWWFFGDERFEEMMIVGPVAHLIQIIKVCFLLLLFIFPHSKRKIFIIPVLIGSLVTIYFIQVKYHLIWLIVFGFLYLSISKKLSGQLKGVALLSFLVILIMNIFWLGLTFAWGTFSVKSTGMKEYLLYNSINYFVSGPILLDRWLNWPGIKPEWTLLTVFYNIGNILIGNPYRIDFIPLTSHGFLETAPGITSNVGTAFGVYFIMFISLDSFFTNSFFPSFWVIMQIV